MCDTQRLEKKKEKLDLYNTWGVPQAVGLGTTANKEKEEEELAVRTRKLSQSREERQERRS
jgi:hypothetical protein